MLWMVNAVTLAWLWLQDDFMKAVRKLGEAKKLEGQISYSAEFGNAGKS